MTLDWRRLLSGVALLSAAGEVVSAFFIEFPAAAIVFAALFLVGWWWLRRGGIGPVVLLLVLCAIEAIGFLFYEREDADDWILQIAFLVLGVVGVVSAVAVLLGRRVQPA
jgi:hypothetical protein